MTEPTSAPGSSAQAPAVGASEQALSGNGAPAPFQIPFRTIFWTVVGFTAAFWLAYIVLALAGPDTEQVKTAIETMKNAGLSGVGTIFGLAGGALSGGSGSGQG